MLHDSDASTLAPDSPLQKGSNSKYSPENIKKRLRHNRGDLKPTNESHQVKTTVNKASSHRNRRKEPRKKKDCTRRMSKEPSCRTTQVNEHKASSVSYQNTTVMNNAVLHEEHYENEPVEKVAEQFRILQENWQLRWEILHLKWQQFQTTENATQRKTKRTSSQQTPPVIIEISAMWQMFMDNMALVKMDDNQDGNIIKYSLESTSESFIFQELPVSSNQRISFLLYLLHNIIAIYKQPNAIHESECFDQNNELFYQVWKSLTMALCGLQDLQSLSQSWRPALLELMISLFSDIVYGNIQLDASEAILKVFLPNNNMTEITEYLGRQLKTAIIQVIERSKTKLLESQPHHLMLKGFTDLVLLLERLPFSVWDEQNASILEQTAIALSCRYPFIATLLFAVSLHHKHKSTPLAVRVL